MSQIKTALIGCGNMGKSLISQLQTIEGAQLVAGADLFEASRDAFAQEYTVPVFSSLADAFDAVDIDAVIVAVPNDGHAPATVEAARAGKHVFCEKPMALTLSDCQAMIDACDQANVKLQIGQVLRYLAGFAKAIEMTRAGDIGAPLHGSICRYGPPRAEWGNKTWRDDPTKVGHNIFEVSVHEIDFMRCIFGKPVAVSGWDISFNPESPLWAKATTGVVEFESGGICSLVEGNFNAFGRTEVELSGTEGAIRFHWGKDFAYKSLTGKSEIDATGEEVGAGLEDGRRRELREWIEAIASDTPPTIPGAEGMANIEIALAILASSERGARLELPLAP